MFSPAATATTQLDDLAGLLCGPGQIARCGRDGTARLSSILPDDGRGPALVAACSERGVEPELTRSPAGTLLLRTAFRVDLIELADRWSRGAVKWVPDGLDLPGSVLRIWALAAGRPDGCGGYLLGLDPHNNGTHRPLANAVARAGLRAVLLAGRGRGGAQLRISSVRQLRRLGELLGPPPARLPAGIWPVDWSVGG
jgi:hypothetical protein